MFGDIFCGFSGRWGCGIRGGGGRGGGGRGIWARTRSRGASPLAGVLRPFRACRVGRKGWTLYLSITYLRGCEGLHPSLRYYAPSGLVGSGLVDRARLCIWVLLTFGGARGYTPRWDITPLQGLVGSGSVGNDAVYLWVIRSVGATCH